jgi:hypothetical protein
MTLSKSTKNHDQIRHWAEERGAVPSEVASTGDGQVGIIRFQFPRFKRNNDSALREISWDEFFEKFDENNLEMIYQEKTASGRKSNFNKLIHPESERRPRGKGASSARSESSSARHRRSA